MHPNLNRPSRVLQIAAALFPLVGLAGLAQADIFQWEYINPVDPSQGKRQSTTLAPEGAGVAAVPGANLEFRNLTMAHLIGADLRNASFNAATLTEADFAGAKIGGAKFGESAINFDGVGFSVVGTGITLAQLYSTASYQNRDLSGISFESKTHASLSGADFRQVNLTNASFEGVNLGGADFRQANLNNARLHHVDLSGANFAGQDLSNTSFYGSWLGADFTGANVRGTNFDRDSLNYAFVNSQGWLQVIDAPVGTGIGLAQLYSTASYQAHDLNGIQLSYNYLASGDFVGQNLTNAEFYKATLTDANFQQANVTNARFLQAKLTRANFAGQNLTNAYFFAATLTDANFTGADVREASFGRYRNNFDRGTGIALAQLYSTESYQARDLSGIGLSYNNLAGGNFAGQNLSNAFLEGATLTGADFHNANLSNAWFQYATLTGTDLTGADVRGAYLDPYPADAITANAIRPDGHIDGLGLALGGFLIVRDHDGSSRYGYAPPIPITIDQHLAIGPGGALRMVFEADDWDSTISFAPGIPVTLGGELELTFAADVNLGAQLGRTFHLFNWSGVTPAGAFGIATPYAWDLSNLYTTGEVTLTAIPESDALLMTCFAFCALVPLRRLGRVQQIAAAVFPLVVLVASARADIFQWEYINPANPDLGKRQSTTRCPDGAGVNAIPGAEFFARDLSMAYLIGANLRNAHFEGVTLTDADFTDSDIHGARFDIVAGYDEFGIFYQYGTGITPTQLYPTANFRAHDLSGTSFLLNDFSYANLANQNLRDVYFDGTTLTGAEFTNTDIRGARFGRLARRGQLFGSGITLRQLYSTASYQARDLSGVDFRFNNLAGGNFAALTINASFVGATLTGADFTAAEVRGSNFAGAGLTVGQLYSTASYQKRDLTGIGLSGNDLSGADFNSQNLTNTRFSFATLTGAAFTDANVHGADFSSTTATGFSAAQLYTTANYKARDLSGLNISSNDLNSWNFARQNLTSANFQRATLTDADFSEANLFDAVFAGAVAVGTNFRHANLRNADFVHADMKGADLAGADVRGARFRRAYVALPSEEIRGGIALEQLYSTASYQAHDLSGIDLGGNCLAGGKFAGQNLANANFQSAYITTILTGANFIAADARGAYIYLPSLEDAISNNLIRPDGHINGLDLNAGELLDVRDYDGDLRYEPALPPIPITIDQHLSMAPGGTLRMVFEADVWDSTISFAPGIPVTLGGTLELTFAADVNPASQLGRTFDLFDWTGVAPTGAFAVSSPYAWNLSNLYTTGEVTLTAIPEPDTVVLMCASFLALFRLPRRLQ
jgi:uncharacterized protein YjbI with pentapeptide repeats